jgi:hypothetical protein
LGGYPGEIPDDIKEYLDDDGEARKYFQSTQKPMFLLTYIIIIGSVQFIGPIKSLFWYDELVRAIDDPAYVIKNEVRVIPDGTGIGFLLDEYSEEGKIPEHIYLPIL